MKLTELPMGLFNGYFHGYKLLHTFLSNGDKDTTCRIYILTIDAQQVNYYFFDAETTIGGYVISNKPKNPISTQLGVN